MSSLGGAMSFIHKTVRPDSRRTTLLAVAVGLLAAGCSQAPAPSVQADKHVANSFAAVAKDDLKTMLSTSIGVSRLGDVAYLEIKKDALDKEFLLSGSIIAQRGAPTSSGLQGRVVAFSKKGKSIFLMEATDGHIVNDVLPSSLILAEIPVILETENSYILDFNSGMKNIFTNGNWYASDTVEAAEYSDKEMSASAPIRLSYLNKIAIVDDENIEIRQIVQAEGGTSSPNFEVRYFLKPYVKNEAYKPTETESFDRVGFFETPPVLEKNSGRSVIRTTHFDISKPVKYYVSSNTPKEYQQAVMDGILYWNSVFGKEVIQAEIAPEGVTAPDARYNIVQWVEWDQAGFAYADALMDPRTGETQHAQVYMTSAFAWGSNVRANRLIRQTDESSAQATTAAFANKLGMKNIPSSMLCLDNATPRMAKVAALALQSNASDETLQRLAQDYIREVVSHEIGHTLGLRHNFAGNFGGNASPAVMDARVAALVKDASTPVDDIVSSSSVMEYQDFSESVITGQRIARKAAPYAYDLMAIRHGYYGEEIDPLKAPLFCTDSHAEAIADCVRFDRGRNPIEGGLYEMHRVISQLPSAFVEAYISAMAPVSGEVAKEVDAVSVDPDKKSTEATSKLASALAYLNKDASSLLLMRKYLYLNSLNKDALVADRYNLVKDEAARQGGFKKMIFDVLTDKDNGLLRSDWSATQVEGVRKFLAKASVTNFRGLDNQSGHFSDEQKAEIVAKASPYFVALQQKMIKSVLALYAETSWTLELDAIGNLQDDGLTVALEEGLGETMKEIVLRRGEDAIVIPIAPDNKVLFKQFAFSLDARKQASTLLGSSIMALNNWSKPARDSTKADYEKIMTQALSIDSIDKISEAIKAGNRPLEIWWKKEGEVYTNLQ
ncbi:MAG: zinc-dependent metalloprotease [Bdellovibrionota bacterium]